MHKAMHGGLRQRKGLVPLGVCMEPGRVREASVHRSAPDHDSCILSYVSVSYARRNREG